MLRHLSREVPAIPQVSYRTGFIWGCGRGVEKGIEAEKERGQRTERERKKEGERGRKGLERAKKGQSVLFYSKPGPPGCC